MFLCTGHHLSHFSADFGGLYLNYVSIYKASKKRGFTNCSTEMFYVENLDNPRKLHLFLELTINYPCFLKANQNLSF